MGLQSSDLILVERGAGAGAALYKETYGNKANIDSSDLILVGRTDGNTGIGTVYKCTYANFSSAQNTDLILVEANSTTDGRVVGNLYKETKSAWDFSAYADIHSANYMVTLGTLTYGATSNNATNFSVVETQVEVSSSSSNAKGNLFIGFRNSAPTSWMGDLPIAAVQILHANGTTFRDTDEFLMDFNFGQEGGVGVNGRYWWETTHSTNTNASTHPNTYSYYAIDDTRTKREFSYTEVGTVSSWVGAAHGISTSTYDSDGGTVLAVGNQNISQYNAGAAGDDGYIFSECSSTTTGDLTWLELVNTGYIYNGDRIRICYFGGANGQTSSAGLQTTNSLYLRFEED
tara:strand:- start:1014 stop:2048 length:1035 start_codon:yes stop_codon:yes gene_type:complete